MKYTGSCHCGKVAYDVEGEIQGVISCNCSMCQRKGSLLWFVPHEQFRLKTPASEMGTYLFNKHVIEHHFCKTCGIHAFAEGKDRGGRKMAAINIRCLEGIDLEKIPVTAFDGRSR